MTPALSATAISNSAQIGLDPSKYIVGEPLTLIPFGGRMSNTHAEDGRTGPSDLMPRYVVGAVKAHYSKNHADTSFPQIDSTNVTPALITELRDAILKSQDELVVVTCGTYKLSEIAVDLEAQLKAANCTKRIIFTGSFDPGWHHPTSATFEIGAAMAWRYHNLENGVYVSMQGQLFKPEEVEFNEKAKLASHKSALAPPNQSAKFDRIRFIGFGGTIEGQDIDSGFYFPSGFVTEYLTKNVNLQTPITFENVAVHKDSRQIAQEDINQLKKSILDCEEQNVLFSVGTIRAQEILEQIRDDADFSAQMIARGKRAIAVCALLHPTEQKSDFAFNIATGLIAAPALSPGLYLCVHGMFSTPGSMTKDPRRQMFIPNFNEMTNLATASMSPRRP